jgi:hypothetical protein
VPRRCITLNRDISSFVPAKATPFLAGPTQHLGRRSTTTTPLATTIRPSLAAARRYKKETTGLEDNAEGYWRRGQLAWRAPGCDHKFVSDAPICLRVLGFDNWTLSPSGFTHVGARSGGARDCVSKGVQPSHRLATVALAAAIELKNDSSRHERCRCSASGL